MVAPPDTRKKSHRPAKPPWLKRRLPNGPVYEQVRALLDKGGLHTVCQEARCPNLWECFSEKTSTFMILGDRCSRNCRFCAVAQGPRSLPDPQEPERVAVAVAELGLAYVVVTSVTRDDLADGGAGVFAHTIRALRRRIPGVAVEVLIPDFQGTPHALRTVVTAAPDVLNHNIETVPRLYPTVRPEAVYRRSLELLARSHRWAADIPTKSGLMLGLGETDDEIHGTLEDLRQAGVTILTLGQYLQPTAGHLPVSRFVPPDEFDRWRETALSMGFVEAAAGPFVRSSYHARESYARVRETRICQNNKHL